MKFLIVIFLFLVIPFHAIGQNQWDGVVIDKQTNTPISDVYIYNQSQSVSTYSNKNGAFSILLEQVADTIYFHQIGYEDFKIIGSNKLLKIYLKPIFLDEITVSGVASLQNDEGNITINKTIISALPTIGGEVDFISSLVIFPSVSKGEEISKGISVRGGSIDQNTMHINGIQTTNTGHLFNLFSSVPSVAIEELKLYSGGIPANFGNAISSALGVTLLKPKKTIFKVDIGASNSKISYQAPFGKNRKSSILLSGRTSYLDLLRITARDKTLNNYQVRGDDPNFGGYYFGYSFYDYLGALTLYLGKGIDFNLFGLYSYDKNTYIFNQNYLTHLKHDLYNLTTGAILTKTWSKNRKLSARLGFNNNAIHRFEKTLEFEHKQWISDKIINHEYGIQNWTARLDYTFPILQQHFSTGIFAYQKKYNPGTSSLSQTTYDILLKETNQETLTRSNDAFHINTVGFYLQSKIKIKEKLKINFGLRNSAYFSYPKTYYAIEPRLSTFYKINKSSHIRGSFDYLTQFDHGLVLSEVGLDNIITLPSLSIFKPAKATNYALGFVKKLMDYKLILSTDFFYKKQWNLQRLALDGKDNIVSDTLTELVAKNGHGYAYGFETQVTYQGDKMVLNLSYAYGHSIRQFDDFNNGKPFYFGYDKPHELNISSVIGLGKRSTFSLNFNMTNGSRYTLPSGKVVNTAGQSVLVYNGFQNASHLPFYHRLDVAYQYNLNINEKWKSVISLNIINVYNKRNINFTEIKDDGFDGYWIEGVSYVPILPSLNVKFSYKK